MWLTLRKLRSKERASKLSALETLTSNPSPKAARPLLEILASFDEGVETRRAAQKAFDSLVRSPLSESVFYLSSLPEGQLARIVSNPGVLCIMDDPARIVATVEQLNAHFQTGYRIYDVTKRRSNLSRRGKALLQELDPYWRDAVALACIEVFEDSNERSSRTTAAKILGLMKETRAIAALNKAANDQYSLELPEAAALALRSMGRSVVLDQIRTIHEAASTGSLPDVRRFLSEGISINQKDYRGSTALHWAATGGQLEMIHYLVEQGADIDAEDSAGFQPLHVANQSGQRKAEELLKTFGATGFRRHEK